MTEKKIITVELANKNIEFILHTHLIEMRKSWYGILESKEGEVAYVFARQEIDFEETRKEGCDVFKLKFVCGTRRMRECTPDEMIEEANRMMLYADATKKLNEMFENVLVKAC